jgi:hypothetical protein
MREIRSYLIVDKLINMFDNWLKHRQEIREMREFNTGEFARIAHELGVTPDDLDTLVRRGPHAIEELPKLLTALEHRRDGHRTHIAAGSPRHGARLCVLPTQAPVRSRYRGRHLRAALRGILRQRSDHQLTGPEGSLTKMFAPSAYGIKN